MSESQLLHRGAELLEQIQAAQSPIFEVLNDVASCLEALWQPDTCPIELLPWLAWSQSVTQWNEQWPEPIKRQIIAQSYEQHKHLGTRFAIINALAPFGYDTRITEWFEQVPKGPVGTIAINVAVSDRGLDESLYQQIFQTISANKRHSIQFDLSLSLLSTAKIQLASATLFGSSVTVYPYYASEIVSDAQVRLVAASQSCSYTHIYPRSSYAPTTILDHADTSGSR